ncbi:hypothetical protein [Variovorax saccharolyticus]|uniref:hypothetical protein n=1 Tax=Variovorax saccharolyticus TaxID=3053516 RepID=UPI002578D4F1|nr:hypothetical protein [Variovorax sp. J31P216]MDM0029651.1 hypothetical protein [Variovorax sp. J31P216]
MTRSGRRHVADLPEGVIDRDGKYFATCSGCERSTEIYADIREITATDYRHYCGGSPRCCHDPPADQRPLQRHGQGHGRGARPATDPAGRAGARFDPLHLVSRFAHLHRLGRRWPDHWPVLEHWLYYLERGMSHVTNEHPRARRAPALLTARSPEPTVGPQTVTTVCTISGSFRHGRAPRPLASVRGGELPKLAAQLINGRLQLPAMLPFFNGGAVPSRTTDGQFLPELAIVLVESLDCDLEAISEVLRVGFHAETLTPVARPDWRLKPLSRVGLGLHDRQNTTTS